MLTINAEIPRVKLAEDLPVTKQAQTNSHATTFGMKMINPAVPANMAEISAGLAEEVANRMDDQATEDKLIRALSSPVVTLRIPLVAANPENLRALEQRLTTLVNQQGQVTLGEDGKPEYEWLRGVPKNFDPLTALLNKLIDLFLELHISEAELSTKFMKVSYDIKITEAASMRSEGFAGLWGAIGGAAVAIGFVGGGVYMQKSAGAKERELVDMKMSETKVSELTQLDQAVKLKGKEFEDKQAKEATFLTDQIADTDKALIQAHKDNGFDFNNSLDTEVRDIEKIQAREKKQASQKVSDDFDDDYDNMPKPLEARQPLYRNAQTKLENKNQELLDKYGKEQAKGREAENEARQRNKNVDDDYSVKTARKDMTAIHTQMSKNTATIQKLKDAAAGDTPANQALQNFRGQATQAQLAFVAAQRNRMGLDNEYQLMTRSMDNYRTWAQLTMSLQIISRVPDALGGLFGKTEAEKQATYRAQAEASGKTSDQSERERQFVLNLINELLDLIKEYNHSLSSMASSFNQKPA